MLSNTVIKNFLYLNLKAEGDTMQGFSRFLTHHGKPMFTIHTDHHDSQSGVGETLQLNLENVGPMWRLFHK